MKRTFTWAIGIGCLAAAMTLRWPGRGQEAKDLAEAAKKQPEQQTAKPAPPSAANAAPPAAAKPQDAGAHPTPVSPHSGAGQAASATAPQAKDGTVIYTFADDAKMREFTELWQQR